VPGDLATFVRDCVERQRARWKPLRSHRTSHSDHLPEVRFDRDALAEIVQNLLDNAEKYARGNGNREILISLASADHSVTLSVPRPWAGHSAGHAPKALPSIRPWQP